MHNQFNLFAEPDPAAPASTQRANQQAASKQAASKQAACIKAANTLPASAPRTGKRRAQTRTLSPRTPLSRTPELAALPAPELAPALSSPASPAAPPELDEAPSARIARPNDTRKAKIAALQRTIDDHGQRHASTLQLDVATHSPGAQHTAPWQLAMPAIDRCLPKGLACDAIHEIKPASPLAVGAVTAFILHLLKQYPERGRSRFVWCGPVGLQSETGLPGHDHLQRMRIDPREFVLASPRNAADALWTAEHLCAAGCFNAVVLVVEQLGLENVRRLLLACQKGQTPCLAITLSAARMATGVSSRWRIDTALSAPNIFAPQSPGAPRFDVQLSRANRKLQDRSWHVEWVHEAHALRVVSGAGDGITGPPPEQEHGPWRCEQGAGQRPGRPPLHLVRHAG